MDFTLAYVGNKGTHVFFDAGPSYDLNQPTIRGFDSTAPPAPIAPSRYPLCHFAWTSSGCSANATAIYSQNINFLGANSSSHYHALQATLDKRVGQRYSFMANYTWSRLMDFSPIYFNQNPWLGYGPGDFDRRHVFSATHILTLPFGKGEPLLGNVRGASDVLVSGWSLSGTTLFASGLPFSPTYAPNECVQDRDTGPCQPNVIGQVQITGDRNRYFTTVAPLSAGESDGPWQRPAPGTFGDARRNSLRGPAFFESDLSLGKQVQLHEALAVQFRWDVYNVFNNSNLGQPTSCIDCPRGGEITSPAVGAVQRQMQFALRLVF
jgi:hypothetical protein